MTNLAVETWIFFAIWLAIGLAIYFSYGQRHSRLNERFASASTAVNGAPVTAGKATGEDEDELTRA
jgi:basic amino acid/polyamine antiporter, APA family